MKSLSQAALFSLVFTAPLSAQVITGPATAIDGRTLDLTGTPIRLAYIDAPEIRQTCDAQSGTWACGNEAKVSLSQIVQDESVTCTVVGTDPDDIKRAVCEARRMDIGREMVRRGMALEIENSPAGYDEAERIAQRMRFGMWAGEFQQPAQWRAENPNASIVFAPLEDLEASPAGQQLGESASFAGEKRYTNATGCAIKGNYSRYGDLIYHLPGQRYYRQTRPEELFCTESAARAAGFRRSKE